MISPSYASVIILLLQIVCFGGSLDQQLTNVIPSGGSVIPSGGSVIPSGGSVVQLLNNTVAGVQGTVTDLTGDALGLVGNLSNGLISGVNGVLSGVGDALKIKKCSSTSCNNGICIEGIDSFSCKCDPPWSGSKCDTFERGIKSDPIGVPASIALDVESIIAIAFLSVSSFMLFASRDFIPLNMEQLIINISLILKQVIFLTARNPFRMGISPEICRLAAMAYSLLHHIQVTQLMLQSHLAYYRKSRLMGHGWWPKRNLMIAIAIIVPVAVVGIQAALDFSHFAAANSCLLNLTHDKFKGLFVSVGVVLMSTTLINWEAGIHDEYDRMDQDLANFDYHRYITSLSVLSTMGFVAILGPFGAFLNSLAILKSDVSLGATAILLSLLEAVLLSLTTMMSGRMVQEGAVKGMTRAVNKLRHVYRVEKSTA